MMAMDAADNRAGERGMTLLAVLGVMTVFAIALLAVAPTVQIEVQRERELESIRRGEEVAEAIRQYVEFYRGQKLPNSMNDLLDGLPEGTHSRMILRRSAAVDPLSEDGKWRLVKADLTSLGSFAKHVQDYNGGLLPSNPSRTFDRYAVFLVNSLDLGTDDDITAPEDASVEVVTDNTPFIGVASQSRSTSIISYYGIENHSKWVFTPLFRGAGASANSPRPRPNSQPPGNVRTR